MRRLRRRRTAPVKTQRRFNPHAVVAGATVAISLAGHAGLAKSPDEARTDAHQTATGNDADKDMLTDREEVALGYQPFRGDQNRNGTLDGAELAMRCAQVVVKLPLETELTSPNQVHKRERLLLGLETCSVCGETVNMGTIEIINPRLGLRVEIPVLAVHCMEHGAPSYAGDIHDGRVDVPKLARALALRFPHEPDDHQLSLDYGLKSAEHLAADANDLDGDMLADSEEVAIGSNLYDADQDNNLLPDGIQLARRCADVIGGLPTIDPSSTAGKGLYKISYMMRGLESCEICGEPVNMGYWQVVNSDSGVSMDIPEIARHFMEHGSFSYLGSVHGAGRAEVASLLGILGLPSECGDLGTVYAPADLNKDCKVDGEDFTLFVEQWLSSVETTEK